MRKLAVFEVDTINKTMCSDGCKHINVTYANLKASAVCNLNGVSHLTRDIKLAQFKRSIICRKATRGA